jgi:hypothetical protein
MVTVSTVQELDRSKADECRVDLVDLGLQGDFLSWNWVTMSLIIVEGPRFCRCEVDENA